MNNGLAVRWLVVVSLGAAACGGRATPQTKTADSSRSDLGRDCSKLDDLGKSFSPPAEPSTGADIAGSFGSMAKLLRAASFSSTEVREVATALADQYDKVATNGAQLEKDFAALESSTNTAGDKNLSLENSATGIQMTCQLQKSATAECTRVLAVLEGRPVLRRSDAQDPTDFIAKLGVFRQALHGVRVTESASLKQMVHGADDDSAALEAALQQVKAARKSASEHILKAEQEALSARITKICPAKGPTE